MRETQWIEWTRTRLQPREREDLLAALTPEQQAHLLELDYVWVEGIGVLWKPPDGKLRRRARFTHGIHFRTRRGEFYIDSQGSVRELLRAGASELRRLNGHTDDRADGGEHPIIRKDDVLAVLGVGGPIIGPSESAASR